MATNDPVTRAFAAYFRGAALDGARVQQPGANSGLREHEGLQYVALENVSGVLAVYRIRKDGMLKRMKRWPAGITSA